MGVLTVFKNNNISRLDKSGHTVLICRRDHYSSLVKCSGNITRYHICLKNTLHIGIRSGCCRHLISVHHVKHGTGKVTDGHNAFKLFTLGYRQGNYVVFTHLSPCFSYRYLTVHTRHMMKCNIGKLRPYVQNRFRSFKAKLLEGKFCLIIYICRLFGHIKLVSARKPVFKICITYS